MTKVYPVNNATPSGVQGAGTPSQRENFFVTLFKEIVAMMKYCMSGGKLSPRRVILDQPGNATYAVIAQRFSEQLKPLQEAVQASGMVLPGEVVLVSQAEPGSGTPTSQTQIDSKELRAAMATTAASNRTFVIEVDGYDF